MNQIHFADSAVTASDAHVTAAAEFFNEHVQPSKGSKLEWTAGEDGKLHAKIELKQHHLRLEAHENRQQKAEAQALLRTEISDRESLDWSDSARLTRVENAVDQALIPLGSIPGKPERYTIDYDKGEITVDPARIDIDRFGKNHRWSDEQIIEAKAAIMPREQLLEQAGSAALGSRWSIEKLIEEHGEEIKADYKAQLQAQVAAGKVLVLNESQLFGEKGTPEYLVKPSHDIGSMTSDASREELAHHGNDALDKLAHGATRLDNFRVEVDGQKFLIIPSDNNGQQAADWSAHGAGGLYSVRGDRQPLATYKGFNPQHALTERIVESGRLSDDKAHDCAAIRQVLEAATPRTDERFFELTAQSWLARIQTTAQEAAGLEQDKIGQTLASSRSAGAHAYLADLRDELASHAPLETLAEGLDNKQIAALGAHHRQNATQHEATTSRGERAHFSHRLAGNAVESGPMAR